MTDSELDVALVRGFLVDYPRVKVVFERIVERLENHQRHAREETERGTSPGGGRERCESVIDVPCDVELIRSAVQHCVQTPFPDVVNPHERGDSAAKIAEVLNA